MKREKFKSVVGDIRLYKWHWNSCKYVRTDIEFVVRNRTRARIMWIEPLIRNQIYESV